MRKIVVLLVMATIFVIGAVSVAAQEVPPGLPEFCNDQPLNTKVLDTETDLTWTCTENGPQLPNRFQVVEENQFEIVEPTSQTGAQRTTSANTWSIVWYEGATQQMRGIGENGWSEFLPLDPENWPDFPNVDNRNVGFTADKGLEFGEDESEFCGVAGDGCEVTVPAMHYRIVTGDWSIPGIGECITSEETPYGCALMLVNVGEVTSNWAEDVMLNNVYTVAGRYWHGDFLPEAIWGALSHVVGNMLNEESVLNPENSVNAGANCSTPQGCAGVRAVFAVTSGNEVLILGETIYRG